MADRTSDPLVRIRAEGLVQVLAVRPGPVRAADAIAGLGHDLRRAIEASDRDRFVLDLSEVTYLTSAALGLVINLHAHLQARGYALAVVAPPGEVAEVFAHTRLGEVIPVYARLDAALDAVGCDG